MTANELGVRFYCGIGEKRWNYHPVQPGKYACISPVKGASERTASSNSVYVPDGVEVIQDSGAFSDSWKRRLSFESALDRQKSHADRYGYADKITHRASYDWLIDEVWVNGNRHKRRWTVADAERAVSETIAAAQYLNDNRDGTALVLSAQGVDAKQYLQCVERIVPLLDAHDVLGLGGWCVVGKFPKVMLPVFHETVRLVIPYIARHNVRRVHIWGVIYPRALGCLLWMCNQYGIELSTDSAGPTIAPAMGQWGYGEWRDNNYAQPSVETRGAERARHVQATIDWLRNLHATKWHREPIVYELPLQLELPLVHG